MKELKSNKRWVEGFKKSTSVIDDLDVLLEFCDAGEITEEELEIKYQEALLVIDDMEFKSTLNRPEDELSCYIEINAGAGGTESCDWSAMLLRMYQMWAERNGFKIALINYQDGDAAGIKTAELEINGDYAYGMLKAKG